VIKVVPHPRYRPELPTGCRCERHHQHSRIHACSPCAAYPRFLLPVSTVGGAPSGVTVLLPVPGWAVLVSHLSVPRLAFLKEGVLVFELPMGRLQVATCDIRRSMFEDGTGGLQASTHRAERPSSFAPCLGYWRRLAGRGVPSRIEAAHILETLYARKAASGALPPRAAALD
jgi:hypothetical protein